MEGLQLRERLMRPRSARSEIAMFALMIALVLNGLVQIVIEGQIAIGIVILAVALFGFAVLVLRNRRRSFRRSEKRAGPVRR